MLYYNLATAAFPKHLWDEAVKNLKQAPHELIPNVQAVLGIPDDSRDPLNQYLLKEAGLVYNLSQFRTRLKDFGLRLRHGKAKDLNNSGSALLYPLKGFKGLLAVTPISCFVFSNCVKTPDVVLVDGNPMCTYQSTDKAIEQAARQFLGEVPEIGIALEITTRALQAPPRPDPMWQDFE